MSNGERGVSTRKSTAMSVGGGGGLEEPNNENDGSVGNQSGEKGQNAKLEVLRRRHSQLEGKMPKDISRMIKQIDSRQFVTDKEVRIAGC